MNMGAVLFDTLSYSKKLKEAGVPEKQAEVQAEALAEIVNDRIVTKEFLTQQLKELEYRLIIKLGAIVAGSIAAMAALIELIK